MGLRTSLSGRRPSSRRAADLAAPLQLAQATRQSRIQTAHHSPRPNREQPVEAPHLAGESPTPHGRIRREKPGPYIRTLSHKIMALEAKLRFLSGQAFTK